MRCIRCKKEAEIELKSHNAAFCRDCFIEFFYRQIEKGIKQFKMFSRKDRVLVAVSGGKDSMALWDALIELGYRVEGLFIDLGIDGFSEFARDKVVAFASKKDVNLKIVDLKEEGIPIPEVVKKTRKVPCAICGQIKRYYFNKAGVDGGFDALVTGHNLDDEVGRLFSNLLHWKMEYLEDQSPLLPAENGLLKKAKPMWRLSEYETAAYAFFRKIDYVEISCPLSKGATFRNYKKHLNQIEYESPATKIDFYQGFLKNMLPILSKKKKKVMNFCKNCGYPTFGELCTVCRLKSL